MKKTLTLLAFSAAIFFAACTGTETVTEKPYLSVVPESVDALSGDGDMFTLQINSNVSWTIGCDADWIVLEQTSGNGSVLVNGAAKRGSQTETRKCELAVSTEDFHMSPIIIELTQKVFSPVIITLTVGDVIKTASVLADGASEQLVDFSELTAQVATDPSAGNAPEGYVVITDNGKDFIRLVTEQKYELGTKLKLDLTGASAKRLSSGNYCIEDFKATAEAGTFSYEPAVIDALSVPSFENCFVKIENCQVQDAFLGKKWSEAPVFVSTKNPEDTCFVNVLPAATFAAEEIPGKSGCICGIVAGGKLMPRTLSDIALTDKRVGEIVAEKTWLPIPMHFKSSAANVTSNMTLSNGVFTFSEVEEYSPAGASITFGGGLTTAKFGSAAITGLYTNTYITSVNWIEGAYIEFKVPVTHEISGECEFLTQITCAKPATMPSFSFEWSLDGGSWNKMDAIYSYSTLTKAAAENAAASNKFNIPSVSTYQQGSVTGEFTLPNELSSGYLYFRITALGTATSLTQTVRLNAGACLMMKTKDSDLSGATVLASENFENCKWGPNPVSGVFMGTLTQYTQTNVPAAFSSNTGWSATGGFVRKGCILFVNSSGENWLTSPALNTLSAPTDITVTFKVAPYVTTTYVVDEADDPDVKVKGSGTVVEVSMDKPMTEDPFNWHTGTAKISGANADTQIEIGKTLSGTGRFYIKDVKIFR